MYLFFFYCAAAVHDLRDLLQIVNPYIHLISVLCRARDYLDYNRYIACCEIALLDHIVPLHIPPSLHITI